MNKREEGEPYTEAQSDFVAGRLEHQKQFVLRCKKAREHIICHPGITTKQLKEQIGAKPREIVWLLDNKYIHYVSEYGFEVTAI